MQMPVAVYILISLFVLILLSGGYVFLVACVRRKELPWSVDEELAKTPYGKHIQNIRIGEQFLREHNARPVEMITFDGLKLHAMWVPAKTPRGTMLFAHGYRSNKLVDFSLAFEFYHSIGMNLLIPDQRAHGKSEGRFITFGVKESRDMERWIDFHNENFGAYPIILSGLSMGASTMLYLVDRTLPENVKGIIADCGFTSPKDILSNVFRSVTHLPAAPTLWVTGLFTRLIAGFGLNEKDTRKSLAGSRLPVFMVHGVDDGFVPCDMTRQGYAACTGKKKILLVEGADHGVSFLVDRQRYTEMIREFLRENVGETG